MSGKASEHVHVGDAGGRFRFRFFPTGGTSVFDTADSVEGRVSVAVGTFADPDAAPPTVSVYDGRCHSWVRLPDGIVRHATDPD